MTRALAIISGCLLLITACKKNALPEPAEEVPDFFLDCKLNQQPVLLEAGNDNYFMNTSWSYGDSIGVYVFEGNLSQTCGGNCGYGFKVQINDSRPRANGTPIDINEALHIGSYSYNDNVLAPDSFMVQLSPLEKYSSDATYDWTIASNAAAEYTQRGYNLNTNFKAGNTYTVKLYIQTTAGCFTDHIRVYKIGSQQGNIIATKTDLNSLTFKFESDIANAVQYTWDFGDGKTAYGPSVNHPFALKQGYYTITLTVTTASNETIVLNYQVPGTNDPICMANFNADIKPFAKTNVNSRVTVFVTDPAGNIFSTKDFLQPATSTFIVDEVSDYAANANNDPTKKLKVRLNCILRNGSQEMTLSEGKASIGVAYKP